MEQERNFLFCPEFLLLKPKRFKLHQDFLKTKQNVYNLKNFWKLNKTKAFGPKILRTDIKRFVSIQNFDLKTFTIDLF
jgi:hypothetical protein